jgi:hypothetical protein
MRFMGRKLPKPVKDREVSKTFRLPPSKITAAQRALGAATAPEAIETALDPVVFRRELVRGTEAMFGVRITPSDDRFR